MRHLPMATPACPVSSRLTCGLVGVCAIQRAWLEAVSNVINNLSTAIVPIPHVPTPVLAPVAAPARRKGSTRGSIASLATAPSPIVASPAEPSPVNTSPVSSLPSATTPVTPAISKPLPPTPLTRSASSSVVLPKTEDAPATLTSGAAVKQGYLGRLDTATQVTRAAMPGPFACSTAAESAGGGGAAARAGVGRRVLHP